MDTVTLLKAYVASLGVELAILHRTRHKVTIATDRSWEARRELSGHYQPCSKILS